MPDSLFGHEVRDFLQCRTGLLSFRHQLILGHMGECQSENTGAIAIAFEEREVQEMDTTRLILRNLCLQRCSLWTIFSFYVI